MIMKNGLVIGLLCFVAFNGMISSINNYRTRTSIENLEQGKVVFPPVTFTKWSEKPYDIGACYQICVYEAPTKKAEFHYACETCLMNMEGSGVACGIQNPCDKKLQAEVVTGVIVRPEGEGK